MRGTTELLRRATMTTEPVFPPAPAAAATAPPNTLLFDSTLSSERRPSTRPSDVAGEGRAFSVVAVASVGRFVWECRKRTSGKKGRCGRRFGPFAKGPANHHAAELSETRDFAPANRANSPHSATSAAVPMEKSLIDGEAGNEEPDLGVDDANPTEFPASLFPFSAADERCESRRMSEDMVSR